MRSKRWYGLIGLLSLLGFVAFCVAPFLLVVWLFAGRYKKIVTSLGARSARSDSSTPIPA